MNSMSEYRDSDAVPRVGCFRLPAMRQVYHIFSSQGIITRICVRMDSVVAGHVPRGVPMRPSWKLALIGGEVTVLAAFTGVGIHLVMQPHRDAFRPPPITLPTVRPAVIPALSTPL